MLAKEHQPELGGDPKFFAKLKSSFKCLQKKFEQGKDCYKKRVLEFERERYKKNVNTEKPYGFKTKLKKDPKNDKSSKTFEDKYKNSQREEKYGSDYIFAWLNFANLKGSL